MSQESSSSTKSTHGLSISLTILKFVLSFAILGYLFYQAWKHDQFAKLAETDKQLGWLAFAVASGLTACMLAFFRWHQLVRAIGLDFKIIDAIRLGFLGHLFNLMSFGVLGGDAIKAMFVARKMKGKATEAVTTVFADRVIGLTAMFMFAGVAYLVTDFSKLESVNPAALAAVRSICRFALFCAVSSVAGMFALLIFENWQENWLVRKLISIPKIGGVIERLLDVIHAYRSKKMVICGSFLFSFASIVLFAVSIYSIARGISGSYPSIGSHLMIAPIAMVANAVPLPGGLGGMEFALDFLYRGFSQATVPSEHGFVVALGFRLILLSVAAIGVFVYLTKKAEYATLQKNSDEPQP